jgi:6-pyruvoyltetrahydropterin/6-carboxytetrahydropterin synthase
MDHFLIQNQFRMIYLTRRETFSAAHRMFKPEWTDDENQKVFGKCSNLNWHGHNYVLYVTVKGDQATNNGFVINMNILKKIIKDLIIEKIDHKNLNLDVPFMVGLVTTTENLAIAVWNELKDPINNEGAILHCVKIEETENNTIEYYG